MRDYTSLPKNIDRVRAMHVVWRGNRQRFRTPDLVEDRVVSSRVVCVKARLTEHTKPGTMRFLGGQLEHENENYELFLCTAYGCAYYTYCGTRRELSSVLAAAAFFMVTCPLPRWQFHCTVASGYSRLKIPVLGPVSAQGALGLPP